MGKYQLSRKDSKLNNRYHTHLAREQRVIKLEQSKQLKAAEAKSSSPTLPDSKAESEPAN